MKIEFKNKFGKIIFSGGLPYGRDTCYIVEISGLGLSSLSVNTTIFSGVDGAVTTSKRLNQRHIVITADVPRRSYDFQEFYGRFLRILSEEGELFVTSRRRKRKITAFASNIAEGKNNGDLKRVVITFTCDSPYFTDFEMVRATLLTKNKYLETYFTLPLMLSEKISRAVVTNSGDINAEPIIYFKNGESGKESVDGVLTVTNETTGQVLQLNYYPMPGEAIVIDIASRTVASSGGANLLTLISDDTDLSEFWLVPGDNVLNITSNIINNQARAECSFYNRYIEGVSDGY